MAKKKLTDRQRVLRRYPKAWCWRLRPGSMCAQPWFVDKDDDSAALGAGATAKEAWADAARTLKK